VKVIPVIDIQNGSAVHAVRGKRKEYKPLKSILCDSAEPLAVACAFKTCGFNSLYIADLDAISGKGNNFATLQQITQKTGLELMVDTGVSSLDDAEELFRRKVSKVIVGTETLSNLNLLKALLHCYGSEKIVFSLDLKNGKILSKSESVSSTEATSLGLKFQEMGVAELIVLDLARVGSGEGVDLPLLKQLTGALKIRVDVGGGIRDLIDLAELKKLGIHVALIATALHTGKISIESLLQSGFL
jgi:phosphoribosylformimino-5-aminoimidazole carboxamide ribotide isomerase